MAFSFATAPKAIAAHSEKIEIQKGTYHIYIRGTNASADSNITIRNAEDKPVKNISMVQIFSVVRDKDYPLRGRVFTKFLTIGTMEAHEGKTIIVNQNRRKGYK